MVAKSVQLVIDEYGKGTDYRTVRNMLVELSKDLGFFQAPANLGYVIIGLLYGEGDFKKSMLYAINCGDDTDCTAATVGATLGLMGGTAAIPDDWREYIGDKILNISINGQKAVDLPKSCTELTNRVLDVIPDVMKRFDVIVEFVDGETELNEHVIEKYNNKTAKEILQLSKYSYEILNNVPFDVRVEYDECPCVKPGDTRKVKVHFMNKFQDTRRLNFRLLLPDGWSAANHQKTLCLEMLMNQVNVDYTQFVEFEITAGENLDGVNNIYLEVNSPTYAQPVVIPIVFVA